MTESIKIIMFLTLILFGFGNICAQNNHPHLFLEVKDRADILKKIDNEDWAGESWENIIKKVNPYVNRHAHNPDWIVSRLAMYWRDGEHFTQCYIKNENWDYGEGNAPLPTVRLPGMRTWNDYLNVPLEDRKPYNVSGDMLGISRSSEDKAPVLIPYKESGHMIRANNKEILELAEKSAFVYFVTQKEKYAKFSADILWHWLLGTYYMNPPLDPSKSTKGKGGYEPGGIMGYYDYEVIHDDRQDHAAVIYDFIHDYMNNNPHKHLKKLNKTTAEIAGEVFKRFIEIGLIRGNKRGNWNINRYRHIMNSILILEPNHFYKDGKGREYYIPFYTEKTTKFHAALPEIMKTYDEKTGLWPESPGYASSMIPFVLNMGLKLYKAGVNTLGGNPMISKAALANLGWLDPRGNLVVFGDMRGGPADISSFESLLTYFTWEGDIENAKKMASVISKGIENGQYDRNKSSWKGIILNQELPETESYLPFYRTAYSPHHRHLIMKNENDEENALMFTLYGGKKGGHLAGNGLAMQFYGKGWALAPDASAYESYWSSDSDYHRGILGSNTIVPGYSKGGITINGMDPFVDSTTSFYNTFETSKYCSFADISADEKRRAVAMIRTSKTTGYYVDVFRSDQLDNDYIHHNLGDHLELMNVSNKKLNVQMTNDLGTLYDPSYSFFKNQKKIKYNKDFCATWSINTMSTVLRTDMWMMGQEHRTLYTVAAPPTTLRSDITPGQVNKSPRITPTLIVRQKNNNAKKKPFLAVFESYEDGSKSIQEISKIKTSNNFASISVRSNNSKQYICNATDTVVYEPIKNLKFQGVFGVASEKNNKFQYLYLGKGKQIQKGNYKIEAVGAVMSAELRLYDGKYFYSSDKPILIQLKKGEIKMYPAGYNIEIK